MSRARFAAALVSLALAAAPALAQNFETAVMPGKVIAGHAKIEADCGKCHVRFERSAQPGLCLDCHQEVARDVRAGAGHHGRMRERDCRRCHTDHRGRDARIVRLDEKAFDHAATDFPLQDRHATARCASCHRAGAKHREAPSDCIACHRREDVHEGRLGVACAQCHEALRWKDARFDHAQSRFPLLQRHAQVKCAACHASPRYSGTPRECAACHRKDDAHRGIFGERCAACHDSADWKRSRFQHDRDTAFALRERHRSVKCEACHRLPAAQAKTPAACYGCHRKDDAHQGTLGEKCGACHNEARWKQSRFEHDRDSRFALRGGHRALRCAECHRDPQLRDRTPRTCVGCHRRTDQERAHRGRYGEACDRCHLEEGWKKTTFLHDRDTQYPLRGRHALAKCDACHAGVLGRDRAPTPCIGCHERDDRHLAQLGRQCDRCHGESGWRETTFNHAQSRFALAGKHAGLACKACHATPAYLDARADCAACHERHDAHRGRLGPRCEQCHDARGWKPAPFDHQLRTRFSLDGAHARLDCLACHTTPVTDRFVLGTDCASCHARRDDVHFGSLGAKCERCHLSADWRTIVDPATNRPMPARHAVRGARR